MQGGSREWLVKLSAHPGRATLVIAEGPQFGQTQLPRQTGRIPHLRMRIQRQMIGKQVDLPPDQRHDTAGERSRQGPRPMKRPEQPVMHHQRLRLPFGGHPHRVRRGRHGKRDPFDHLGPLDLQAIRTVIGEVSRLQEIIEIRFKPVAGEVHASVQTVRWKGGHDNGTIHILSVPA